MRRASARLTGQQWAVRAGVVTGPLVALLAGRLSGAVLPPWVLVLVLVTASTGAARPRSHAGALTLVVVLAWWWVARPADGPLVLLAAVGLVAAHVCGVLAAYGPGRLVLDPALLRRWAVRAAAMVGAAALSWVAVRVQGPEPALLTVGLALVTVLAWWAFARLADRT